MARQTEGANVVQVTLPAALGHGSDVVGVPERAAGCDGLHTVEGESGDAGFAAGSFERGIDGYRIRLAELADASVAGEDLIAEVAGIGAQTPLVDAVVGAEGATAFGEDFHLAPAAEGQAVRAGGQQMATGATAGEGARDKHRS